MKKIGYNIIVSTRSDGVLKFRMLFKKPFGEVTAMELSARQRAVLSAIIRSYIETGEPVGSKSLTLLLKHAPSSATLRNEMSELSSLGLLHQPHTSAGRVPTHRAYQMYVQSLMQPLQIGESTRRYIASLMDSGRDAVGQLPVNAAKALSELTGFPAIASYEADTSAALRRAEIIPAARRAVLIMLVSSDGQTKSRLCRLPQELEPRIAERFKEIVNSRLLRKPLSGFTRAELQNVIAASGLDALELTPVITALFEMAADAAESPVTVVGAPALYDLFGEAAARRLLQLSESSEPLIRWLDKADGECEVLFGSDSGYGELSDMTFVIAKYRNAGRCCGRIGIIGPGRMSYEKIVPSIEYTAAQLTGLVTSAAEDMED